MRLLLYIDTLMTDNFMNMIPQKMTLYTHLYILTLCMIIILVKRKTSPSHKLKTTYILTYITIFNMACLKMSY